MKGVQCYELFGGIALKNLAFFITNTTATIAVLVVEQAAAPTA